MSASHEGDSSTSKECQKKREQQPANAGGAFKQGHRVTMSLSDMQQLVGGTSEASKPATGPPTFPEAVPSRRRGSLATPEEFVGRYGGKRAINKVLIANNGIAGKKKFK